MANNKKWSDKALIPTYNPIETKICILNGTPSDNKIILIEDLLNPYINLKANLDSPTFTGTPLITTTPSALDNSHKIADTAYVDAAVPSLVDDPALGTSANAASGRIVKELWDNLWNGTVATLTATPTALDNSKKIATTEYVDDAVTNKLNKSTAIVLDLTSDFNELYALSESNYVVNIISAPLNYPTVLLEASVFVARQYNCVRVGNSTAKSILMFSLEKAWLVGEGNAEMRFAALSDVIAYLEYKAPIASPTFNGTISLTTGDFTYGSTGGALAITTAKSSPNNYDYSVITAKRVGGTVDAVLKLQSDNGKVTIGSTEATQQFHTTGNIRIALSKHITADADGNTAYGVIYKGTYTFLHNFNYGLGSSVTTDGGNTFLGLNSGNFTMGSTATNPIYASRNTIVGAESFKIATNAYDNTGVGHGVFAAIANGTSNVAIGNEALSSLTTGYNNVAIGNNALLSAITNRENVAIGIDALRNATGWYNTVVGSGAGSNITSGNVTMVGYNAGRYYGSGTADLTSASTSTFIGQETRASAITSSNEIVIGYNAIGNGNNTVTLGNDSIVKTILKGVITKKALDSAPASASANGVLGEIRITATYIYVCTATNTWVRTALTTW